VLSEAQGQGVNYNVDILAFLVVLKSQWLQR